MSEKANKYQQALLSQGRSRPKPVTIKGVDGEFEVLMLPLTVGQHTTYHFDMLGKDGKPDMAKLRDVQIKLVKMSCVDEDCVQVFTEADLSKIDHGVLAELYKAAQAISGLDKKIEDPGNG